MSRTTMFCPVLFTGLWHFARAECLGSLASVVFLLTKIGASVFIEQKRYWSRPNESRIASCLIGIFLLVSALWLPTRVIGITGEMCLLNWTRRVLTKAALLVLLFL